MIIAIDTQDRTTKALAIIGGRELEITVYQVTTHSNPNTWGMWLQDLETGEQGFASYPCGEDWTAARFYNVILHGEDGRIGHPRSLDALVEMAFSEVAQKR